MFKNLPQRHEQFQAQAKWTRSIRAYLMERSELNADQTCLEVGCGTGVLLKEWEHLIQPAWGIDLDLPSLQYSDATLQSRLSAADVLHLPFAAQTFDCIFCHYFFLWVNQPTLALQEILRCLKPGGWLLTFAEPDYGGRIDYPQELEIIREIQCAALQNQGADPLIGRKMKALLTASYFHHISGGILGSEWLDTQSDEETHIIDIQNTLYDLSLSRLDYDPEQLKALDQQARLQGSRLTYVPTFFYSAQKSLA